MAGLFFWHNRESINPKDVDDLFCSLEYNTSKYIQFGKWNILVFPKKDYSIQNWQEYSDGAICCVGTFAYRGKIYEKSLHSIYQDFNKNIIQETEFWGSFIIIIINNSGLHLIRDGAGLTRLYRLADKLIFSTSFTGLIDTSKEKLTFNKDAATELLTTGVITGTSTIINEIYRIPFNDKLNGFNITCSKVIYYSIPKIRKEALNQQIDIARNYFKRIIQDWKAYMPESVLDVGITGGMDSRLVAALTFEVDKKNVVFHTHWRKEEHNNTDFHYANIFVKELGGILNTKEVVHPFDMSGKEIEENFRSAYNLSDGVIRSGCYWDEQYSTAGYRSMITKKPYLRFLGFGGEQYRNHDRYPLKSIYSLKSWIRWGMIYNFAGRYFNSKNMAKDIEKQIEMNLKNQFWRGNNVNLYFYKQYVRLIQTPSYRSLQASMENRLGFCLNPFLDINLSLPAQNAVPFLGKSLSFQLDMIKRISPTIAEKPNAYNFNFSNGEPILSKLNSLLWVALPPGIKYTLYSRLKNFNRSNYIPYLAQKHNFINELENLVTRAKLPIDFSKYRLVKSRGRLMLNLGYFLKRNENNIHI